MEMQHEPKNSDIGLESILRRIIREEIQVALGNVNGRDLLLTAEQAAELMACSADYLYRRAKSFSFSRRVGRMLRFSEKGILAYLDAKKPARGAS